MKDDEFGAQIKSLKFLVLDEADRMIETGHFAELDNVVRLTSRAFQYVLLRFPAFSSLNAFLISMSRL